MLRRTNGVAMAQPGQPPRAPMTSLQAETDDQGHFAFHDLAAGGYQVTVQRQGFVGQNGTPGVPAPNVQLWLGEGQQLTGYAVHVTPQAIIAGRVLDEYGDPVMGALVFAQRAGNANGPRTNVNAGNVQSNDLGEYRIANLGAGDYVVAANYQDRNRGIVTPPSQQLPPDKPQLIYATTYHPGTAVASEAGTVHVTDGAVVAGIDIKFTKTSAYSIHLTVADPGAPANTPAFPNLRPRDPSTAPGGVYFGPQREQDGSYLFTGVPAGSYELTAQRNSMGTPGIVASATMPIEVRDRNLEGVVLQVKPNADLQGVVRFEQPGECGVNNLSVMLRPPMSPEGVSYQYGPLPQPAPIGDDLRFTLISVPSGVYSINLQGLMGRCYVKSISYAGQTVPEGGLTVSESGSLDLTLAPYNASLSVMVVGPDGNSVPRARITAVPKDGSGMTMNGTSGSGGQTTLGSIRPGTYDVYAFEILDQNAFYPQPRDYLRTFAGRGKTVTVPETGRATVEVTAIPASETGATAVPPPPAGAKGSLAGKVVNAVNGSAMADVVVTLRGQFSTAGPPRGTPVVTDDQGRFSFPDLAPGQYSLNAMEQRFLAEPSGALGGLNGQVIVGEGQQVSAYIMKLAPAGVIAGTVKDEFGEPALGARVQAYRYRNQLGQRQLMVTGSTQTDDLGRYRIPNLAPGDYYVEVAKAPPRVPPLTMRVESVATNPVTEITTPIESPTPRIGQTSPVETIAGPIPTGETDYVAMWYPNAAQASGASAVRLAVGATAGNIDMTWRKTAVVRIRGKLENAPGGAATITLKPKDSSGAYPSVASAIVARDGTFEISAVPAGSYTLIARSANPSGLGGLSSSMAVQAIEVKDSPIEGIQMALGAGRSIKGSVRMEGGGAFPRPGFFSLRALDGFPSGTINIGGDGTFTVNNVFPLVYTLNSQNLPANTYIKSIRYGGQELPLSGFELKGDGQLEVVLSGAAAVLEGSVTGADGKPAGLAGIVVAPAAGPSQVRTGNADANVNFYFANLPPGDYRVIAWDAAAPEASDPPESLGPFARYAKTVTVGESAHEKLQTTVVPAER